MVDQRDHVPYVYLIGWSDLDLWYLGCELKNGTSGVAHPSNLWTKYFTSSYHVRKARERYGEPDVIQVRRTFTTAQEAHSWEQRALRRIGAVSSRRWLNKRIFDDKSFSMDEDVRAKIIETRRKNGQPWHSPETISKIAEAKLGIPQMLGPEVREARASRFRVSNADPNFQARRVDGCRKRWSDTTQVSDQSDRLRTHTHNEEARAKALETRATPEHKRMVSEKSKANWPSIASRMKSGHDAWLADPANKASHAASTRAGREAWLSVPENRASYVEKLKRPRKAKAVLADGVPYRSARECAERYGKPIWWVYDKIAKKKFVFIPSE